MTTLTLAIKNLNINNNGENKINFLNKELLKKTINDLFTNGKNITKNLNEVLGTFDEADVVIKYNDKITKDIAQQVRYLREVREDETRYWKVESFYEERKTSIRYYLRLDYELTYGDKISDALKKGKNQVSKVNKLHLPKKITTSTDNYIQNYKKDSENLYESIYFQTENNFENIKEKIPYKQILDTNWTEKSDKWELYVFAYNDIQTGKINQNNIAITSAYDYSQPYFCIIFDENRPIPDMYDQNNDKYTLFKLTFGLDNICKSNLIDSPYVVGRYIIKKPDQNFKYILQKYTTLTPTDYIHFRPYNKNLGEDETDFMPQYVGSGKGKPYYKKLPLLSLVTYHSLLGNDNIFAAYWALSWSKTGSYNSFIDDGNPRISSTAALLNLKASGNDIINYDWIYTVINTVPVNLFPSLQDKNNFVLLDVDNTNKKVIGTTASLTSLDILTGMCNNDKITNNLENNLYKPLTFDVDNRFLPTYNGKPYDFKIYNHLLEYQLMVENEKSITLIPWMLANDLNDKNVFQFKYSFECLGPSLNHIFRPIPVGSAANIVSFYENYDWVGKYALVANNISSKPIYSTSVRNYLNNHAQTINTSLQQSDLAIKQAKKQQEFSFIHSITGGLFGFGKGGVSAGAAEAAKDSMGEVMGLASAGQSVLDSGINIAKTAVMGNMKIKQAELAKQKIQSGITDQSRRPDKENTAQLQYSSFYQQGLGNSGIPIPKLTILSPMKSVLDNAEINLRKYGYTIDMFWNTKTIFNIQDNDTIKGWRQVYNYYEIPLFSELIDKTDLSEIVITYFEKLFKNVRLWNDLTKIGEYDTIDNNNNINKP